MNSTTAQTTTTMPFQKIGASARIPVIEQASWARARGGGWGGRRRRAGRGTARRRRRGAAGRRLGRIDADVLGRRDLLDRQDVVHDVVDLLVVHRSGEANAPRRHVGARPTL